MTTKKYCKNGHEMTPANTMGNNACRKCMLAAVMKRMSGGEQVRGGGKRPLMVVRVTTGRHNAKRYWCDDGREYGSLELSRLFCRSSNWFYSRLAECGLNNPAIFLPTPEYMEYRINAGFADGGESLSSLSGKERPQNLRLLRPLGSWERAELRARRCR